MAALLALLVILPGAYFVTENRRLSRELDQAQAAARKVEPQNGEGPAVPGVGQSTIADKGVTQMAKAPGNRREPALDAPRVNTPIFVLSAARDASGRANEIVVDSSTDWFVITLELEGAPQFKTYRATIRTADNRIAWTGNSLAPNRYDSLTMSFHSGFFRSGDYVIALEGNTPAGPPAAVANFPFRVIRKK